MPSSPHSPDWLEALLAQVRAEMRERLAAGQAVHAETFLEANPTLAEDPRLAREVILAEIQARREVGQPIDFAELRRRFPQWAADLQPHLAHSLAADNLTTPPVAEIRTVIHQGVKAPPTGAEFPLGEELGGHELLEEIGRGGMGVVYKARDLTLGRVVALKVLRAGILAGSDEVIRFHREARTAAQLRHPHLMPVLGMGLFHGQHAFTMPLVTGGSLAQHLVRFRDVRAAVVVLLKVARAVAVAHQAGIVHRDLKPANVLLDEHGEPLVSDFGLAKWVEPELEVTQTGQVLGTPAYMSPEQAAGRNERVGPASDVWSLGVMLFVLLAGRKPFEGASEEMRRRILRSEPANLRSLRREVPGELGAIVGKCLEKQPEQRYPTARELADDLECWLEGRPITGLGPTWWRVLRHRIRRVAGRPAAALLGPAGVVLLGAAVLTTYPSGKDRSGEESSRAVQALQKSLEEGRPTTLVGADGSLRWSRWFADRQQYPPQPDPRGHLTISSWKTGMLELLPDPVRDQFRLRAEVCYQNGVFGSAGLYWSGEEFPEEGGTDRRFCTFRFNEGPSDPGRVDFLLCRERDLVPPRGSTRAHQLKVFSPYALAAASSIGWGAAGGQAPQQAVLAVCLHQNRQIGRWHRIEVTVTSGHLTAHWDGRLVSWTNRRGIDEILPMWWRDMKDRPARLSTFGPRGSLGLFVERGKAWFRNVVVEPLPPALLPE
jgi:hypothetical protein